MNTTIKEEICKKFFDNKVKAKHLSSFCEITPEGNVIKGYISHKPNRYLGSMIITKLKQKNGVEMEVEQFIQSFPKIHYWNSRHQLKSDGEILYMACEKLDGTCLIMYPLKDENGNVIEIVPKTRGKAVADKHILQMYNQLDKKAIIQYFKENTDDILMFELYGILNKHEITYSDTYIDIRLIGVFTGGEFLTFDEMRKDSRLRVFNFVDVIYIIYNYENEFFVRWLYTGHRLKNYRADIGDKFPTLYDAIAAIKASLQNINDEYMKYNSNQAVEGIVINASNINGSQMYLKLKPEGIVKEMKAKTSIPRKFILKEVRKYFDEYSSDVEDIFKKDENHAVDYVCRQLKEEFDSKKVDEPKTRRKIKNVFMDVWDSRIPPVSLQNICDDLVSKNPDADTGELMRIFADTYPSKKKKSRFVFNILKKMVA